MNLSLETVIGKGNSGVVFKGYYQDQLCALKHAHNCREENDLIQILDHENIIKSYGISEYGEREYMILEYMNKGDLKQFLKENQCTIHEIMHCILQLAKAVEYLHSQDIIHTDIAARNCLLSQKKITEDTTDDKEKLLTLKLSDFGKCVHNMQQPSSPRYALKWASPEVINSGALSKSSDVWAFGITLYEILTQGEQLFPQQERAEIERNIKKGCMPELPEDCPKILRKIIHQCLQPNPENRPTMKSIVRKLKENFYRTESLETLLLSVAPPQPEEAEEGQSVVEYANNDDDEFYYDHSPRLLSCKFIEDIDATSTDDYCSLPLNRI